MSILNFDNCNSITDKITILDDLVPNIKKYVGEIFVIHYDGQALYDSKLAMKFAHDIVLMKQMGINIIIVHGGEKIVDDIHKKFNFNSTYVDDTRVTDKESIEIVEMTLTALVNKRIVSNINSVGGTAVGLSGKDANLIEAKKYRKYKNKPNSNIKNIIDLGFIGEPTMINPDILLSFEDTDFIPVISPIAIGEKGETFHINPLTTAAVISSSLIARKLVIIDDFQDIFSLYNRGTNFNYEQLCTAIKEVTNKNAEMLSFFNTCMCVLQNKTDSINIVDGKVPHSILIDLFTNEKNGIIINNSNNYE